MIRDPQLETLLRRFPDPLPSPDRVGLLTTHKLPKLCRCLTPSECIGCEGRTDEGLHCRGHLAAGLLEDDA